MKRLVAGLLAAAVVALSACGNQDEPIHVMTPTPWGTAAPTATGTPSQAELSAMAEKTYRTFFEEWTRLEREGGATEPTRILLDNGSGPYLESVMTLLREQRRSGTTVSGIASTNVVASPGGAYAGVEPRLTLTVCEDHSAGTYERAGVTYPGEILEGVVYLGWVDGQAKLIGGDTKLVPRCSI